jgi:hypothetical protein
MRGRLDVALLIVTLTGALAAAQQPAQPARPQAPATPGTPARDTPAQPQRTTQPAPTGKISGRVLTADNGRPVSRARVMLSASQFQGRSALTDNAGSFELTELPEGRFTLTVSKTGFITLTYGQRRPLQAGTPIQLATGQEIKGVEFRLPRGSAISGRVLDENGEAMPGTQVSVMAYRFSQGARQLVPAGNAQTDDRGEYRVWGLNPGDYYVSASPQTFNGGPGGPGGPGRGGRGGPASPSDSPPIAYAPTYYPGVPSVDQARAITIGLSADVTEISFNVLLVQTSHISGRVMNPDGSAATSGMVNLFRDAQTGGGGRGGPFGGSFGSRIQAGGQFVINNVPPGRYSLRARGQVNKAQMFASMPLSVTGGDMSDLFVALAPAASIAGSITLQNTHTTPAADVTQFGVSISSTDPGPGGSGGPGQSGNARADRTGNFTLDGIEPGPRLVRAQTPRGWALKSVIADGRESIDTPIEFRPGQKLTGVTLVFTDRISEVDGTVTDAQGSPVTEYTVLAFPDDGALWRPQSRQIMTTRPDQNGKYQLRGLPAGRYYLAVIDPAEQGEWYDPAFLEQHRPGAQSLTLSDGDVRTQDFKITR